MTSAIEATTEAGVVAGLATLATEAQQLDTEALYRAPNGAVIDLEKYLSAPERLRGITALHDADSFVTLVKEHEDERSHVYASLNAVQFVAVFNDARGEDTGWGDHRAILKLAHTPEWQHWIGADGKLLSQTAFAEHIEDGLLEIVSPAAAEMLELAQTFHAKTGVDFKSSTMLDSGERKFAYEETTTARAGAKGDISIPKEIELGIRPFEGGELYKVRARFRHRLNDGQLALGYRLDRPHDVIRAAFDETVEKIGEEVESTVLRGTPPEHVGR